MTIDRQTFFDNFAHLADAPNGVQKLRELILQLAVRGKLVPQDLTDEPASKLLERIQAEKARLAKEKSIRKTDSMPPVTADEAPYELPKGWEWVTLGKITEIERGGSPRPINDYLTDDANGLNWIKIGDTEKGGKYITSTREKIRKEGLSKTRMVYPGDFLLTNSMSFGRPYITQIVGCIHDGWLRIHPPSSLEKDYLYHLLSSTYVSDVFRAAAAGAVVLNLNADKVRDLPIPLPPLAEQHRIVTKVDQLMALCDELEAKQEKKRTKLTRLNNSAIDRLLTVREQEEFSDAWGLIRDNFDLLYTTPDSITKLRQAILQLAVQGKLLQTDAREIWKVGVLGDVVVRSEAGWSPQCENRPRTGDEWGVLKVSAVSWNCYNPDENKALPAHLVARSEHEVKTGDFLISRANTSELVAKSVVVFDTPARLSLSDKTVRLHFSTESSPQFFCLVNNSPAAREYYAGIAGGTSSSMKNVTRQQILALPVPIPPLAEQHRIVTKVGQLMSLCVTLENRLTKAQAKAEKLASATVQGLLAA